MRRNIRWEEPEEAVPEEDIAAEAIQYQDQAEDIEWAAHLHQDRWAEPQDRQEVSAEADHRAHRQEEVTTEHRHHQEEAIMEHRRHQEEVIMEHHRHHHAEAAEEAGADVFHRSSAWLSC